MRFKACPILNFLSSNPSWFECHYIKSSSGLEQKENWVATSFWPWIMSVVFAYYVQEHLKWCTLQMNDCVFNFRLWKGYNCWKNNVRFQKNHNSRSVQIKRSMITFIIESQSSLPNDYKKWMKGPWLWTSSFGAGFAYRAGTLSIF